MIVVPDSGFCVRLTSTSHHVTLYNGTTVTLWLMFM